MSSYYSEGSCTTAKDIATCEYQHGTPGNVPSVVHSDTETCSDISENQVQKHNTNVGDVTKTSEAAKYQVSDIQTSSDSNSFYKNSTNQSRGQHAEVTTNSSQNNALNKKTSSVSFAVSNDKNLILELPPVQLSNINQDYHVLYKLSSHVNNQTPKPHPEKWKEIKESKEFVKMPCSDKIKQFDAKNIYEKRWNIINRALNTSIHNMQQLISAVGSYNHPHGRDWQFPILKLLFIKEHSNKNYERKFFDDILPRIIKLALQLPEIVTTPVPLLKSGSQSSLSLSQLQIASLLANAFLCTFPHRNLHQQTQESEYYNFPTINFDALFNSCVNGSEPNTLIQKIKCLMNYFDRVTKKEPCGIVTFTRRCVLPDNLPFILNDRFSVRLKNVNVYFDGTIEDGKSSTLQVDFANKVIGGGVLGRGCVQEEIRFMACPELIVSRLFTEVLDDYEALVIAGVEQYNNYDGYADTFMWRGDHVDDTHRDESGRRECCLVAMDALLFSNPHDQYKNENIMREIHKAFVAFFNPNYASLNVSLKPVATGHWGCGVFNGDPKLKFIIQVLAAAMSQRDLEYFVCRDYKLKNDFDRLSTHLHSKQATVDQILRHVLTCCKHESYKKTFTADDIFKYLYKNII